MDIKIFYINGKDSQRWARFQNAFSSAPEELAALIEKVNFAYSDDYESLAQEFNFSIKPQSLYYKLLFAQFPDLVGQYITHFAIYQKIIEDDLSGALIVEDSVCYSDLLTFLEASPDINEKVDISNLASSGIDSLKAYFITNRGARKIIDALQNVYWLQNVERPMPSWHPDSNHDLDFSDLFLKSDPTIWKQDNSISAPLGWLLEKALHLSIITGEDFNFVNNIDSLTNEHHHNKSTYPDFWKMEEEDILEFIESPQFTYSRKKILPKKNNLDYIYYINLDQDFEKSYNTKTQLSTIDIPHERFSAVKPTRKDIQPDGQYYSFFKRNKFLEACSFFEEKFDWMDQEKYQLGTLGCYLSHYTLLQKIYEDNSHLEHVAILEDDVKINDSNIPTIEQTIDSAPKNWDIIRSTWSSTQHLSPINYCHPLSSYYEPELARSFIPRMKTIKYDCRQCCPVMNTFYGGTHFQIIKVQSIPRILEYLDSDVLLPIDGLYTTHAINVYQKKMGIDFGIFGASSIQQNK
jgi:GR25 family glycosyltransferase involved in LPS biosynthesis